MNGRLEVLELVLASDDFGGVAEGEREAAWSLHPVWARIQHHLQDSVLDIATSSAEENNIARVQNEFPLSVAFHPGLVLVSDAKAAGGADANIHHRIVGLPIVLVDVSVPRHARCRCVHVQEEVRDVHGRHSRVR